MPIARDHALRYEAWVAANRRKVDELSDGKLAYVWVPNTGGGGYQYAELDVDGPAGDGEKVWQVYGNATINIAPGFFIVPEIGYASYDYAGDAAQDKPNLLYLGAKWQINF